MNKICVQYGCGFSAPNDWLNFDASPTLRLQKIPIIGKVLRANQKVKFPKNVLYGDIVKGLPLKNNSCDALYCSHVLEHLSLSDFRIALQNTHKLLKPAGIFRCIVPDLEVIARQYVKSLESSPETASIDFIGKGTLMGVLTRPRGIKGIITSVMGNSHHLWMWDHYSMKNELEKAGFKEIRRANYNDSKLQEFKFVEELSRFENAVVFECTKA